MITRSQVSTTPNARNVSVPCGRNWRMRMVFGPNPMVASPCTARMSPTVPTICSAIRCGARRAEIRSISRPSSGPPITTATTNAHPQPTWSRVCRM